MVKVYRHASARIFAGMRHLELSDEQKEQIRETLKEARQKARDAESPQEKMEIMKVAFEDIKTDVLTEEQVGKLGRMKDHVKDRMKKAARIHHAFKRLNLTDDQKKQIRDIMQKAHQDVKEIMESAKQQIKQDVLTKEQRQEIEKWRKEHPCRRGRRGAIRGHDKEHDNDE